MHISLCIFPRNSYLLYYINMQLGFDLVFSYWLFAWFLLYECGGTTYNPKPWFVIGLLENTLLFGTMLYYRNPTKILILFLLINTCIKLIPLWILRNTSFRSSDVIAGLVLFGIYLGWARLRVDSIQQQVENSYKNIKDGKPTTPITEYILRVFWKP
jgi:hypothetical protein